MWYPSSYSIKKKRRLLPGKCMGSQIPVGGFRHYCMWCERTKWWEWVSIGQGGVFSQFSKYVLSTYYIPGIVLGGWDISVNLSRTYICGVWEGTDS